MEVNYKNFQMENLNAIFMPLKKILPYEQVHELKWQLSHLPGDLTKPAKQVQSQFYYLWNGGINIVYLKVLWIIKRCRVHKVPPVGLRASDKYYFYWIL